MTSRYVLVGVKGFEPPAPCSQSTCATRQRYTPVKERAAQATLIIIFKLPGVVNRKMQKSLKFLSKIPEKLRKPMHHKKNTHALP